MLWKRLKKIIGYVYLQYRMWDADQMAHYLGWYYHMLLPPSFYLSHTEEQIKQARMEALKELEQAIANLPD